MAALRFPLVAKPDELPFNPIINRHADILGNGTGERHDSCARASSLDDLVKPVGITSEMNQIGEGGLVQIKLVSHAHLPEDSGKLPLDYDACKFSELLL